MQNKYIADFLRMSTGHSRGEVCARWHDEETLERPASRHAHEDETAKSRVAEG